jgi:hypothetical protein
LLEVDALGLGFYAGKAVGIKIVTVVVGRVEPLGGVVALEHQAVVRAGCGVVQALLEDAQGDRVEAVADSDEGEESGGGEMGEN